MTDKTQDDSNQEAVTCGQLYGGPRVKVDNVNFGSVVVPAYNNRGDKAIVKTKKTVTYSKWQEGRGWVPYEKTETETDTQPEAEQKKPSIQWKEEYEDYINKKGHAWGKVEDCNRGAILMARPPKCQ